jgi:hypothetical protein
MILTLYDDPLKEKGSFLLPLIKPAIKDRALKRG